MVLDIFGNRLQELKDGIFDFFNDIQLSEFNLLCKSYPNWKDLKYFLFNDYCFYSDVLNYDAFKYAINTKGSRYKKRKRAKNKITLLLDLKTNLEKILNKKINVVFGTLTLNDDTIVKSYDALTKSIQRELKKHCFWYFKNADYGTKTDRLHFHYIGMTFEELVPAINEETGKQCKSKKGRPMFKYSNDSEPLGWNTLEIIPDKCLKDMNKIACYLVKLNNHSNKISTLQGKKKSRLIISKNTRVLDDLGVLNLVNYLTEQYIPKKSKNAQK